MKNKGFRDLDLQLEISFHLPIIMELHSYPVGSTSLGPWSKRIICTSFFYLAPESCPKWALGKLCVQEVDELIKSGQTEHIQDLVLSF